MITLWRIIKSGFRNLFRHAWLSVAATAIMVVTLFVVSFFVFSGVFLRQSLNSIKDKIDVTVYLKDEASSESIKDLQNRLSTEENVKSVTYQSKEDVLKEYENSPDPDKRDIAAAAKLSGAGLSATLLVKLKDLDKTGTVSQILKDPAYEKVVDKSSIDDGNSRKANIEKIGKFSNAAAKIGIVVSVTFLVVALLIIFNTIRMAIFTRREEIEIMKLVGATKWFIRGPFIFEGALYGILGATLAIVIIFPVLTVMKSFFAKYIQLDESAIRIITDRTTIVIALEYGVGILIGSVSSWLAISRHLKL